MNFDTFFQAGTDGKYPRPYQISLAKRDWPETLIIPTGFGKTAAVLAAWLWKIGSRDPATPRRLIYCLPMRTLVEQTEAAAKTWIENAREKFELNIELDVLMGGRSEERHGLPAWMLRPDCPAILIGTQDMLISAALMRGYGTTRYRWPVDFALLHNDALWVFDEVQLTGATLPTSAQLEAFRGKLRSVRPSRTLWMSATLDPQWLKTVDFTPKDDNRCHDLNDEDLTGTGHLWTARKQLAPLDLDASLESDADELAKRAMNRTKPHTNTIIFLNTVVKAQAVFASLKAGEFAGEYPQIRDAADRARLMKQLQTDAPEQGRIIVTTQALKAGIDVASATMMKEGLEFYANELASRAVKMTKPHTNTIIFLNTVARAQAVFASLKAGEFAGEQLLIHSRFRGVDRARLMTRLQTDVPERGRIIVATQALEAGVDVTSATMITEIAPWSSLVQRFGRCNRYGECGEAGAAIFWIDLPDTQTMPYTTEECEAARQNLKQLPDCGPQNLAKIPLGAPKQYNVIRKRDLIDLFDTDPDLSGFDVDVSLYIRDADNTDIRLFWRQIEAGSSPPSDVAAPSREELCPASIGNVKKLLARKDVRAWVWDTLLAQWRAVDKDSVFPGMTLMMDSACGGYDPEKGFDPAAKKTVEPVPASSGQEAGRAIDNDEDTTSRVRVSLAKHSLHARDEAAHLAQQLELPEDERNILAESALWHDLGKAHDVFKARCGLGQQDTPLAKTPDYNWRGADERNRPYFRHELASALAYLAGRDWKQEADLPAYLIAAHHGKVRMRLRALPNEKHAGDGRLFARGVWDGDKLPRTDLGGTIVPETVLDLDLMQLGEGRFGPSWSARCQALLKQYGPFRLAFLEALLRIADWRASEAEEDAGHDDL